MSLSISGGHGSVHRIGEQIQLCYGSLANQYILLYSVQGTTSAELRRGVDDGNGECFNGTVTGPEGIDNIRIDAYDASGTVFRDYAQLSIIVVP